MKGKLQDLLITISAFGLLIVLVISFAVIGVRLAAQTNDILVPEYTYGAIQVVVKPGDTLWSIARTQVPSEDPRDVVGSIRRLNDLSSADIFPGQVLTVQIRLDVEPVKLARQTQ
ncbi:MAG: LysM peptidoglycan-binding domain-containing protein [Firmicutes bacterium]|nr:LysM peptidoglycan-binding domain-containing protein [Bacillota bacterium]